MSGSGACIDVERHRVLYHELVAHGEKSGDTMAVAFSNEMGSHESSLGLFRTEGVYTGQFGYSLRLSGLEPGINDKARQRAIVVHGFPDISRSFAAKWGTIARTRRVGIEAGENWVFNVGHGRDLLIIRKQVGTFSRLYSIPMRCFHPRVSL